jgi:hypothetical protein
MDCILWDVTCYAVRPVRAGWFVQDYNPSPSNTPIGCLHLVVCSQNVAAVSVGADGSVSILCASILHCVWKKGNSSPDGDVT